MITFETVLPILYVTLTLAGSLDADFRTPLAKIAHPCYYARMQAILPLVEQRRHAFGPRRRVVR